MSDIMSLKQLEENSSPLEELLINSPEEFERAMERGVTGEITIQKFTHPLLLKYCKDGKIKLFYTPDILSHKVEEYNLKDTVIVTSTPTDETDTLFVKGDKKSNRKIANYINSIKKYSIPPNKVDAVFDLIEAGKNTSEIVKYLT